MDQERNNLNMQGNNVPLQNSQDVNNNFYQNQSIQQNTNVNTQAFNSQPQSMPNYQQPTNQMNIGQTTQQSINSFENINTNNQNFNNKSPKKINLGLIIGITIAVIIVILGIVLGANLLSKNNNNINNEDNENIPSNNNNDNNNINNSQSDLLTGTLKMPTVDVYVDIPGYNIIEEGYTRIFFHSGKKYITFTCLYMDTESNISESHDKMITTFMNSVSDHHIVNELGETTDKTIEVNGIETYNFEGVLNAGEIPVYDAYIYGYSFIFQGYPTSIIGVVTDESQPEEEKKLVKDIVDAMMKTVRTEP